jgi:N utilization substance protein A
MTPELAYALARNGVNTKNKLAEQSIDDLQEINELNEDLAAKIILEAREDWFKSGIISEDDEGLDQEQESEEQ